MAKTDKRLTTNYDNWTRFASVAYEQDNNRNGRRKGNKGSDKVGRKLWRGREAKERRRKETQGTHRGQQTAQNAKYWSTVQMYLQQGLSLAEAKERCRKRGIKQ